MSNNSLFNIALQKHRVMISRVIWLVMIVYLFGLERITINSITSPVALWGLLAVCTGVIIRSISAGALHKNQTLSTQGIYAIVRNPLYVGSFLMLIGLNIIIGHIVVWIVSLLLFAITYVPTIVNEEEGLKKAYPQEWELFITQTPRFIPNLLKLGALRDANWSGSQWYRNHEHNTILAVIALLAALEVYNRLYAIH